MINEAVGIAINGREVKIAHLRRDKYQLAVDYLESAVLPHDMDFELGTKTPESAEATLLQTEDDLFAMKGAYESRGSTEKDSTFRENVDVIYALLRKFAARRHKVAFNIPPSQVSYQDTDTYIDYNKDVFKSSFKKKFDQWRQGFNPIDNVSVITRKDGTLYNIACEMREPPILDILEQLNTYFKGNLVLSLMDPNEVSLVNMARRSYGFHDSTQLSVIIEIETEFSRIIFMKGDEIFTVSPVIPESYNPDIFGIICSKIIYELDNLNLPAVHNILLAGKASTNTAKTFFEKKFPDSRVGFIISKPLADSFSTQFSREELSEYAIPISLAWKTLQKKEENFIPTNLLPPQVFERQKVLSLTMVGYLFLVLLGISAFVLTWKITAQKLEASSLRKSNKTLVERINNTEKTVKKVREFEDQIGKISKRLVLSDSLSFGSDRLLIFLEKLNSSVSYIKSAWIEQVQSTKDGVVIRGLSLKREDIPSLSDDLGRARINKLRRSDDGNQRLFSFEMVIDWKNELFRPVIKDNTGTGSAPALKADAITINSDQSATSSDWANPTTVTQPIAAKKNFDHYEQRSAAQQAPSTTVHSRTMDAKQASQQQFATSDTKSRSNSKIEQSQPSSIEKKTDFVTVDQADATRAIRSANNSNSRFIIRTNGHANKFTALKDVELYRSNGFDAYITTLPNSSREIPYWVCVGDYSHYGDAEYELTRLNNAIPGKRKIIEISSDALNRPMSEQQVSTTSPKTKTTPNELIHQTNHTISAHESKPERQSQSGLYTITLSAHAAQFTAKKEVEFYQSKSIAAYITTLPGSSREVPYWVCYGKFASYDEAQEQIGRLNAIAVRKYKIVSISQ